LIMSYWREMTTVAAAETECDE